MTAKEMSGFFCAVTPQPETFNVTFCASLFWGRPRLHGQNSNGSCASNHCEIPLECGSVRHVSGCAVSIKSLIVAANNANGSTLNESYCLFAPFELYLPTNGGGEGHTPGTLTGKDEVSRSEEEIRRVSENFRPA
jgi:hypothetical protein